jgi:DNA repair protein RecN (Recombination protein N)
LKSIGDFLVDLHGQHQHQSLLKPETANDLINALPEVAALWHGFRITYDDFQQAHASLERFDADATALIQKKDLIDFQYTEIASLTLLPDEEKALEEEYTLLSSITERLSCISSISALIEGSDTAGSIGRQVAQIRKHLESLQRYDPSSAPWIPNIDETISLFSELNRYCRTYLEKTESTAQPQRLEEINSRLAKIQRLRKKYSCVYDGLLQKQENLREQLDSIINRDADRVLMEKKAALCEKKCRDCAEKLSRGRTKATATFDKAISNQMDQLGFSAGAWRTVFVPQPRLSPNGLEEVIFEVRTNPGEPFLPLIKTASGGEISRLMLAIKTVLAAHDKIPLLIFDEIDVGIGGHTAKEVARAMQALSKSHQVICISHLHQIAGLADNHYKVYKTTEGERTFTRVKELHQKEKIEEISRMLGDDSAIGKKHAEEMLKMNKN